MQGAPRRERSAAPPSLDSSGRRVPAIDASTGEAGRLGAPSRRKLRSHEVEEQPPFTWEGAVSGAGDDRKTTTPVASLKPGGLPHRDKRMAGSLAAAQLTAASDGWKEGRRPQARTSTAERASRAAVNTTGATPGAAPAADSAAAAAWPPCLGHP